jgi:RraA family protein
MTDTEIAAALGKFPTGNLSNAHTAVKAMYTPIAPLFPNARISGPAKTAKITPGDNAAIHRAVHSAKRGDVLVVDSAGDRNFGPFGDILAAGCQNKGIVGLVIDSTIRDTADIRELKFPVYSLGANPMATTKSDPGEIDIDITCGGVRVRPGDFVVGDDDGVMVVPRKIAQDVIRNADAIVAGEETIKARLARGETTVDIFEIDLDT